MLKLDEVSPSTLAFVQIVDLYDHRNTNRKNVSPDRTFRYYRVLKYIDQRF